MKKIIQVFALALSVAAGYAAPANAVQPIPDVTITEYFDPSISEGWFEVTNNSVSKTLHAFAVANDSITGVSAVDWQIGIISQADWKANQSPFDMSYQLVIGNFDWFTYFVNAQQVAAYASNDGLAPGVSSSQFGVSSLGLASPFVAFDQYGQVMWQGVTSAVTLAVPEASNAAMFGVGVLMLAWAVGRRRKGAQALFAA
jgi:hypothetical protein